MKISWAAANSNIWLGAWVALGCLAHPLVLGAQETANREDTIIEAGNVTVSDPYRWLEAMEEPQVVDWARELDAEARAFAARYADHTGLVERTAAAADHDRYLAPIVAGGDRLYYARVNSSFTRVSILAQDGPEGEPRVLVDGDTLARDGLVIDRSLWPSPDGRLLAYGVGMEGSTWLEIRFLEVATGTHLSDRIRGMQGRLLSHLSWAPDGSAVVYDGFEAPPEGVDGRSVNLESPRLAVHQLGEPQADDRIVLEAEGVGSTIRHWRSDDAKFIVAAIRDGSNGTDRVYAFPRGELDRARLIADGHPFEFAGSQDDELWFYTTMHAPNGRVVGIDFSEPDPSRWRDVVPEQEAALDTWTGIRAVGDRLVGGYRNDGRLELRMFRPGDGTPEILNMPRIGSVWFGVEGRQGDPEFYFVLSGFADPGTVFRHDLETGKTTVFREPDVPFDPAEVETRIVEYPSADGRRAPMYLAHLKGTELGPETPVIMYGYGFGGWSVSPWFRPHMYEWFRLGGAFALPALRGGGEFGQDWMRAAMRERRQNAVDDYIAAAEWLLARGLAAPERLVAETNSAGGPVVGAAVVQRPELFAAALFGFPLLDLLRYDAFTGGARWVDQLGSVSNPTVAPTLARLSPVHNVAAGRCYPATLVTPGERDETTPPFHAYKFVAALRDRQACAAPVHLRMSWGAGHAYGRDQETTIRNLADQIAFVAMVLGLD